MAVTFISKGEAELEKVKLAIKQSETEVLYINRFGRKVIIREYEATKFARKGEGEIAKVIGPLQNKRKKNQPKTVETKGGK